MDTHFFIVLRCIGFQDFRRENDENKNTSVIILILCNKLIFLTSNLEVVYIVLLCYIKHINTKAMRNGGNYMAKKVDSLTAYFQMWAKLTKL
jgi:hypothetical protein